MKPNRVRQVVSEGRVAIGMALMEFGTRGVAKLLEFADVDFVQIDMEHSGFGIERVADLLAWFKATDIAPFVRVPENLYHFLAGVLDAGALGVQVANVETADQARAIVKACKYQPLGERGLGLTAAHSDFRTPKAADYLPLVNRETMVLIQIESELGLNNVEEIVSVEGIDCAAVGHNDLTKSMGIHGQFDHPRYKDALKRVREATQRHGKLAKVHPHGPDQIAEFTALGFNLMMIDSDVSIFRSAVKSKVDTMRTHSAAQPVAP